MIHCRAKQRCVSALFPMVHDKFGLEVTSLVMLVGRSGEEKCEECVDLNNFSQQFALSNDGRKVWAGKALLLKKGD